MEDLRGGEIDIVVDLVPTPGREDELKDLVGRNGDNAVARRVGCEAFSLHEREGGRLTVITRWRDEHALRDFGASQAAADHLESMLGLLAEPMAPRMVRPRRQTA